MDGVRLCRFTRAGTPRIGFFHGNKVADLLLAYAMAVPAERPEVALERARVEVPEDMVAYVGSPTMARRIVEVAEKALRDHRRKPVFDGAPVLLDPAAVRVLPPLAPPRILCMARNYAAHGKEFEKHLKMQHDRFTLFAFLKPHTAVQGAFEPVAVPRTVEKLDYEIELAVVIGKGGRSIPRRRAMDHVAGYTIVNDLSDRAGIPPGGSAGGRIDWFLMKARDGFAPLGPAIRLAGPGVDPYRMRMRLWVNGQLRQDALAGEMTYRIDEQVAYLSGIVSLEPGDVIATGSPEGNAAKSGKWLGPGDEVRAAIEGIGEQRFRIVRA